MVATYSILGRQVGSHWLSLATLTTLFGVSGWAMSGGSKDQKAKQPPVNASSKEEEEFINNFLKQAEEEEKKEKAKQ